MTWILILMVCNGFPVRIDTECWSMDLGPFAVECRTGTPRPGRPCDPGSCGAARDVARTLSDVRYAMCVSVI